MFRLAPHMPISCPKIVMLSPNGIAENVTIAVNTTIPGASRNRNRSADR